MTGLAKRIGLAALVVGLVAVSPASAGAGLVISCAQVGSSVVESGTGRINLAGLTAATIFINPIDVDPKLGMTNLGNVPVEYVEIYPGLIGPTRFGDKPYSAATSGGGDAFGLDGGKGFLYVPVGYVSGETLSATDTFANASFASLGLTPGTYTYTLPDDTLRVQIGTAVAEPSSLVLMSIAGLGISRRRRRAPAVARRRADLDHACLLAPGRRIDG